MVRDGARGVAASLDEVEVNLFVKSATRHDILRLFLPSTQLTKYQSSDDWYFNSGATHHVSTDFNRLQDPSRYNGTKCITFANGQGEMGPDFSPKMPVKSLTSQQIVRIHQLFRQAKFDDPTGDCLSPAGEYNLRLGIIKELQPDMVATYAGSPQVFEGHPFIVEAGISLGGKDVKQGVNIFRFANRIPLLFEQGADVVTRTASKRINWNSYKINQMQDKIGVFVSIVSTKIPFKGTGKEYIGDDITEISSAVKSSIQQCCNQLKSKIMKKLQARERQDRKRNLTRYIPDASRAVYQILEEMVRDTETKRQRYEEKDIELLDKVASEEITERTLRDNLTQHVEQVDYEMALEYATQSGVSEEPREDIYLNALESVRDFIDFHTPVFVLRLIP